MILATLYPYLRSTMAFAYGDVLGSTVAHQELMRHAVKHGAVDRLWVFLDGVCEGGFHGAAIRGQVEKALNELEAECGAGKTAIMASSALMEQRDWPATVLVSKAPGSIGLSQMRHAVTSTRVPICSVVHSVMWRDLLGAYWSLLLLTDDCDAIVTTSSAGRSAVTDFMTQACDLLNRRAGARLKPAMPIITIPLGVEDEFVGTGDKMAARSALNIAADAVVILFIGRLSARYKVDLDPLLLAFRQIADVRPDAVLVLAGHDLQGEAAPGLDRFVSDAGLFGRIRIVPNFPAFTKRLIYAAADIFVSPVDNVQETFGISVLEAMAMGLPVVAADWSGYRDLVVHNETGFLVPTLYHPRAIDLANAFASCSQMNYCESLVAQRTIVDPTQLWERLSDLVREPELRRTLGEAGRRRVTACFRWSHVIGQYQELWNEQLRIAGTGTPAAGAGSIDYRSVITKYATGMVEPEGLVQCTAPGRESLERKRLVMLNQPAPAIKEQAFEMLAACTDRPVRVRDLVNGGAGTEVDAVLWLLKKGLIARV